MSNSAGQRAFQNARLQKRQKAELGPLLARALQLHKAGLLPEAKTAYRELLELAPDQFIALHLLGALESEAKNYRQAQVLLSRAVALDPRSAEAHMSLGVALNGLKRHYEARESYRKALALRPNYALALSNLGNASAALELYQEALESYDKALAIDGRLSEAHNGRGWALCRVRAYDEAIASLNRALSIKPDYASALSTRAVALRELQRFDEAMADCNRAIALAPDDANGWLWRASILLLTRQVAEALSDCEKALAADPGFSQAHSLLGQCLAALGRVDEALASFDRALDIEPDQSTISSKIFTLDFMADASVAQHQQARHVWWEQIGAKIASAAAGSHENSRDPDRRLVLGYVSSDFHTHSAAFIFEPVLQHHDRAQFEIVCYACSPKTDATTSEFQGIADRWRDASQWSDDRLAAQIRADGVDILIDLSGHTSGNRLGVFARKPAPVQRMAGAMVPGPGCQPSIIYSRTRSRFLPRFGICLRRPSLTCRAL
ncbi:tetratricopeptide repeat protein [Bradyrhizobium sp. 169]|uniref:tetratricopeptide repeat protein n=1 Tax=Bradyrhizobium sp. 169 TaxID=2782640 RepID=UPI001FFB0A7B|nr:tetratricopeptide repeat protein [Bradyrhizobium sp. 169]